MTLELQAGLIRKIMFGKKDFQLEHTRLLFNILLLTSANPLLPGKQNKKAICSSFPVKLLNRPPFWFKQVKALRRVLTVVRAGVAKKSVIPVVCNVPEKKLYT